MDGVQPETAELYGFMPNCVDPTIDKFRQAGRTSESPGSPAMARA